jgi:hypothetical protein
MKFAIIVKWNIKYATDVIYIPRFIHFEIR